MTQHPRCLDRRRGAAIRRDRQLGQVAGDLVPIISRQRGTVVDRLNALGTQGMLWPNSLFPPFNDPRARLALAYIVDQADTMAAGFGDPRWWRRCDAFFVCGTGYASEAGSAPYARPNLERARSLLAEAGYRGERLVVITPTTSPGSAAWPRWRRPACAKRG